MGEMTLIPKLYNDNRVEYKYMKDEDIVELARDGNSLALDYLLCKYKNFVKAKSAPYFLVGGDRDDIIQEGMIGLFKAIRDYDKKRLASFISFVEICIKRQIITAIKAATRKKHIPLNSYISLNKTICEEGSDRTLIDMIEGTTILDPMEVFIIGEEVEKIESKMNNMLSDLEFEVIQRYLQGKNYEEISLEINRDSKCIDNALQRIKKKLGRDIIN